MCFGLCVELPLYWGRFMDKERRRAPKQREAADKQHKTTSCFDALTQTGETKLLCSFGGVVSVFPPPEYSGYWALWSYTEFHELLGQGEDTLTDPPAHPVSSLTVNKHWSGRGLASLRHVAHIRGGQHGMRASQLVETLHWSDQQLCPHIKGLLNHDTQTYECSDLALCVGICCLIIILHFTTTVTITMTVQKTKPNLDQLSINRLITAFRKTFLSANKVSYN